MRNSTLFKKAIDKGLRIEYADLETSPELSFNYGNWDVNISYSNIIIPTKITSCVIMSENDLKPVKYEWKWMGPIVLDFRGVKGGGDDSEFLPDVVKRLNKADIVIGQNFDKFDEAVLNNRLYELKLKPVKNLITIDTLKLSRRSFKSPSHKLDYQMQQQGSSGKIKQDMQDCIAVATGNTKAQKARIEYNIKDVTGLRAVFWSRLDYYKFHEKTLNMLRAFISEKRIFCIKCAARRQKRFEVMRIKKKGVPGGKWRCSRCSYEWKIKKGDLDTYKEFNRGIN